MVAKAQLLPNRFPTLATLPNLSIQTTCALQRDIRLLKNELRMPADYQVDNSRSMSACDTQNVYVQRIQAECQQYFLTITEVDGVTTKNKRIRKRWIAF